MRQEVLRLCLHEREVCTTEDCFCFSECVLFLRLCDGHFLVEILDQEIDHGDDAGAFPRLLFVRARRLWRWRRLHHRVCRDIREHCDTCACNATGRSCWRQGATCRKCSTVL